MPGVQRAAMRNRAPRDTLELQLQKAGSPRSRQGVETGGRDYFHVGAQAAAAASQSLQSGGRGATPRSYSQAGEGRLLGAPRSAMDSSRSAVHAALPRSLARAAAQSHNDAKHDEAQGLLSERYKTVLREEWNPSTPAPLDASHTPARRRVTRCLSADSMPHFPASDSPPTYVPKSGIEDARTSVTHSPRGVARCSSFHGPPASMMLTSPAQKSLSESDRGTDDSPGTTERRTRSTTSASASPSSSKLTAVDRTRASIHAHQERLRGRAGSRTPRNEPHGHEMQAIDARDGYTSGNACGDAFVLRSEMHSETTAFFDASPSKGPPGRGMQTGDSFAGVKAPLLRSAMHREPTAFNTTLDRTGAWQWTRPDVVATDPGAPFAFRSEMHVPNNTHSRSEQERAHIQLLQELENQGEPSTLAQSSKAPVVPRLDLSSVVAGRTAARPKALATAAASHHSMHSRMKVVTNVISEEERLMVELMRRNYHRPSVLQELRRSALSRTESARSSHTETSQGPGSSPEDSQAPSPLISSSPSSPLSSRRSSRRGSAVRFEERSTTQLLRLRRQDPALLSPEELIRLIRFEDSARAVATRLNTSRSSTDSAAIGHAFSVGEHAVGGEMNPDHLQPCNGACEAPVTALLSDQHAVYTQAEACGASVPGAGTGAGMAGGAHGYSLPHPGDVMVLGLPGAHSSSEQEVEGAQISVCDGAEQEVQGTHDGSEREVQGTQIAVYQGAGRVKLGMSLASERPVSQRAAATQLPCWQNQAAERLPVPGKYHSDEHPMLISGDAAACRASAHHNQGAVSSREHSVENEGVAASRAGTAFAKDEEGGWNNNTCCCSEFCGSPKCMLLWSKAAELCDSGASAQGTFHHRAQERGSEQKSAAAVVLDNLVLESRRKEEDVVTPVQQQEQQQEQQPQQQREESSERKGEEQTSDADPSGTCPNPHWTGGMWTKTLCALCQDPVCSKTLCFSPLLASACKGDKGIV